MREKHCCIMTLKTNTIVFVPAVNRMNRRKTEICRSIFDEQGNEVTSLFPHLFYSLTKWEGLEKMKV